MKTTKILFIVLVALSLLLVGCSSKQKSGTGDSAEKKVASGSKIKDFLMMGGKYKCDYTVNTPEGTATQIIYLDGQNMRAEMKTSGQPGTLILVGTKEGTKQCSFMWTEGAPAEEGGNSVIKACYETAASDEPFSTKGLESGSGSAASLDWNAQADCSPYLGSVDTSVPAGYQVMDLSIPAGGYGTGEFAVPANSGAEDLQPVDTSSDSLY
jgi:hypothetical protein